MNEDEAHMPGFPARVAAAAVAVAAGALGLSGWILGLAIVGAGLVSLTVVSHVRGATAPVRHVRPTPVIELIVSPGAESVQPAAAASSTQSSPALADAKFRLGFLEFEDDVDAPSR